MFNKCVLCVIYARNLCRSDMLMFSAVGSPVGFVLLIKLRRNHSKASLALAFFCDACDL